MHTRKKQLLSELLTPDSDSLCSIKRGSPAKLSKQLVTIFSFFSTGRKHFPQHAASSLCFHYSAHHNALEWHKTEFLFFSHFLFSKYQYVWRASLSCARPVNRSGNLSRACNEKCNLKLCSKSDPISSTPGQVSSEEPWKSLNGFSNFYNTKSTHLEPLDTTSSPQLLERNWNLETATKDRITARVHGLETFILNVL